MLLFISETKNNSGINEFPFRSTCTRLASFFVFKVSRIYFEDVSDVIVSLGAYHQIHYGILIFRSCTFSSTSSRDKSRYFGGRSSLEVHSSTAA